MVVCEGKMNTFVVSVLFMLMLALPADGALEPGRYKFVGWHEMPGDVSCGATARLRRDTYNLTVDRGRYWINHTEWALSNDDTPDMLVLHKRSGDILYVFHAVYVGGGGEYRGVLEFYGRLPSSKQGERGLPCQDTVFLEGRKRR
jgi:hypothetical protein